MIEAVQLPISLAVFLSWTLISRGHAFVTHATPPIPNHEEPWHPRVYLPAPLGDQVLAIEIEPTAPLSFLWKTLPTKPDDNPAFYKPAHKALPTGPRKDLPSRCSQWLAQLFNDESTEPTYEYYSTKLAFEEVEPGKYNEGEFIDLVVVDDDVRESLDVVGAMYGPIAKARAAVKAKLAEGPSPSDFVRTRYKESGAFAHRHFGRPGQNCGLPTTLYSPILAQLSNDLDYPPTVTPEELNFAQAFIELCVSVYDNEDARQKNGTFRRRLLGDDGDFRSLISSRTTAFDGRWMVQNAVFAIWEVKAEEGEGGNPTLQAFIAYGKCVIQEKCKQLNKLSNMPALIIGLSSTRLEIAGAIFTDGVYADIFRSLDLRLSVHANALVVQVAQVFAAVRLCVRRLRDFYIQLQFEKYNQRIPHLFPNPTKAPLHSSESTTPSISSALPDLIFVSKLDLKNGESLQEVNDVNRGHGLFLAERADQKQPQVIVKFTTTYCAEAHHILAAEGLAPKLYSCDPVIGGLQMVVMEKVEGQNLHYAPRESPEVRKGVFDNVKDAVDQLHKHNLVFGDLRRANIVWNGRAGEKAQLVDFDRSDDDGVGRYPAIMNVGAQIYTKGWREEKLCAWSMIAICWSASKVNGWTNHTSSDV